MFPNIPLAKILLIFYVFSSVTTNALFSPEMNELVKKRHIRHIMGFIVAAVLIGELTPVSDPMEVIFYATLTYVLFLLSTKMKVQWNVALIIALVLGYLYNLHNQQKGKAAKGDPSLDEQTLFRVQNTVVTKTMAVNGGIVAFIVVGAAYALLNPPSGGGQSGGGLRHFNIDNYLFGKLDV